MLTVEDFIRPSALKQLSLCPGSAAMQAAVVNRFYTVDEDGEIVEADSAAADTGTKIHAIAAWAIELWKNGSEWGDAIADALNHAAKDLSRWDLTCAQRCCQFARDLIAEHAIERENVLVEHRLAMAAFGVPRGGTADLVLVVPYKLVLVVDWKAGFLDQGEAFDHDQLQAYACAAAETFMAHTAIVYLFQARLDKHLRASAASFDVAAIKANRAWTNAVVNRARGDNPELVAGYAQCLYCKALTHCPAAQDWIMNVIEAFDAIGAPSDPDAWGELVAAAKIAEKRADGVSTLAKARLQNGEPITGWGLAAGREIRSIDATKAIEIAKERGTLDMLLQFASFKAEASKVIEGLEEACSSKVSAPSLRPVRRSA